MNYENEEKCFKDASGVSISLRLWSDPSLVLHTLILSCDSSIILSVYEMLYSDVRAHSGFSGCVALSNPGIRSKYRIESQQKSSEC